MINVLHDKSTEMDGNIYNYNTGSWNPGNQNFQSSYQLSFTRDSSLLHDPSKSMSSATIPPPFRLFNCTQLQPHSNHLQPNMVNMMPECQQWPLPQWTAKAKSVPVFVNEKCVNLAKDDWHGLIRNMPTSPPSLQPPVVSPVFNIPPPGPFCSSDFISDNLSGVSNVSESTNHHQHSLQFSHQQTNQMQHKNTSEIVFPTNNYFVINTSNNNTNTSNASNAISNKVGGILPSTSNENRLCITIPTMLTDSSILTSTTVESKKKNFRKPREKKIKKEKEIDNNDEDAKKKRTRNEEAWARNMRKKARARGESYMSVVGKVMRAKAVQPVDCSKCKFRCTEHVSEEDRHKLFEQYWSLESFKDKVTFLSGCVEEFIPLRPISGKRLYSRRYKLKIGEDEDENAIRVCKEFFISTFDISESTIVTFMNKKRKNPEDIKDCRGHQVPSNKTRPEVLESIKEHILSQTGLQGRLLALEVEKVKNIKRLYTHYTEECAAEDKKPASMSVYRKVFREISQDKTEAPIFLPPVDFVAKNIIPKLKLKSKLKTVHSISNSSKPEQKSGNGDSESDEEIEHKGLNGSSDFCPSALIAFPTSHSVDQSTRLCSEDKCTNNSYTSISSTNTKNQTDYHNLFSPSALISSNQLSHENPKELCHKLSFDNSAEIQSSSSANTIVAPSFDTANQLISFEWGNSYVETNSSILSSPTTPLFNGPNAISSPDTNFNPSSLNNLNPLFDASETSSYSSNNPIAESSSSRSRSGAISNASKKLKTVRKSKNKKGPESSKAEVKKRTRNEESWGRNIRKRLRFKGEQYISVAGKMVEAKRVQDVDCSKCKYKCTAKISEEHRLRMNKEYWTLSKYEDRVNFIMKYVQTYIPKRKMTGRREFSRNYTFIIDGKHVRVCKNFFVATLHISESIVATCLKKARDGPEAITDLRGKHKPVNKTPDAVSQNVRDIVIYLTGIRPSKKKQESYSKESGYSPEKETNLVYQDVNRLYLIYKYDSEKKGRKMASQGVFRSILLNEFGITGNKKYKKSLTNRGSEYSKSTADRIKYEAQLKVEKLSWRYQEHQKKLIKELKELKKLKKSKTTAKSTEMVEKYAHVINDCPNVDNEQLEQQMPDVLIPSFIF